MARSLKALGGAARVARAAGFAKPFAATRNAVDSVFATIGYPPLAIDLEPVVIRGYLRHRSFLEEAAQRGTTYRELFVRTVQPGSTIIDGGAHVGVYTVLGAVYAGASGRVISFEPDPYNLRAVRFNTRRLANVRVEPKALGEAPARGKLYCGSGTIGSSLIPREDRIGVEEVEITTIDRELGTTNPTPLVIKLNIEGAEAAALRGAARTLAQCPDVTLFVEVAPALVGDGGHELIGLLEKYGFDTYRINLSDQSLVRVREGDPIRKGHLMARRPDD